MKLHWLPWVILSVLAGCKSTGPAPAFTGDPKLNVALARLEVTSCQVASVPTSKPGAATPVRARLGVEKSGKPGGADTHSASIGVYDPASGSIDKLDKDGKSVVPFAGALVAVAGSGGAIAWYFIDKDKSGHSVDVPADGPSPVSSPTNRPADPNAASIEVQTPGRTVAGDVLFATDEAVAGTCALTAADAGPATVRVLENGQEIGRDSVTITSTSIQFVPPLTQEGGTSSLVADIRPARPVTLTVFVNCQAAPQVLAANGTLSGAAGAWQIVFVGEATALSNVPLVQVTATDGTPIQAGATVEEAK